MYIDKRTLSPFFKKTNSTPQDLLDWVEFLMTECSDMRFPCNEGHLYMDRYRVEGAFSFEIDLWLNKNPKIAAIQLWIDFHCGDKQPLLDVIKEFKEKYGL